MDRYVLTTLHELIADDYILIYFHNPSGSGPSSLNSSPSLASNNMPTFSWLKRCYHMIDRKLRKNLKALYLVHPTFWLKTLVIMTKPLLRSVEFVYTMFFVRCMFVMSVPESLPFCPLILHTLLQVCLSVFCMCL